MSGFHAVLKFYMKNKKQKVFTFGTAITVAYHHNSTRAQ